MMQLDDIVHVFMCLIFDGNLKQPCLRFQTGMLGSGAIIQKL